MAFYRGEVVPRLVLALDAAFPEFGWRRDARGWVATDREFTHARFGVRPDRVVAHGEAPAGFLIHGADAVPWTAYVNDGQMPRGERFAQVVRELAARVDVDTSPIDRAVPPDRRAEFLHDFFALCRRELAGARGTDARRYLEARGIPEDAQEQLGRVPADGGRARRELESAGHAVEEIAAAGLFADRRWPGRIVGAWSDERSRIRTLWARQPDVGAPAASKYLYLRRASRTGLPPYGFDVIPSVERRRLVLVEGVLDVHHLQARGLTGICALGGTGATPGLFERLARAGVETVTLALDNDPAGIAAAHRAVRAATRADRSPELLVLDPSWLGESKDPDALLRTRGAEALQQLLDRATCGVTWHALHLCREAGPDRRRALERAGQWLGTLPPRLALQQEDALAAGAALTGYSREAVERAFRARFWAAERPDYDRPARQGPVMT